MSELDKNIYYGRGNAGMYDDYMDFINYVFGFNGNSSDFKKLLPKLYRPEDDPAGNSYVAVEDGKLKAAVGAFDLDVSVDGEIFTHAELVMLPFTPMRVRAAICAAS
mgnify:CR=1 FL=1